MTDRTRPIKDILWILVLFGLVAGAFRMWFGLGATTDLSDAMPWGLWKILNMVAGVALSTSGFTVGFLVYVLRLERFRPLMKPAILIAFLGYGCSTLALLFDIGLPHRFWHPIFMWNEHSFLFEVFWCVMLYFTVTFVEMLPNLFERLRAERINRLLHAASFGIVVVGISLSSLHHSSLGSLFLVTPQRLHALWYSPWLPWFFILSAMGGGIMMLVLVRILYARWYDPEPVFGPKAEAGATIQADLLTIPGASKGYTGREMPRLVGLASIGVSIMGVYTVLKVIDLFRQGAWNALAAGTWESWLYGLELCIAALLPILLVIIPRTRRSPVGLGVAAFSGALGLALNRLDVGIFGYFRDAHTVYFPTLTEWALGVGVIAAAGLAFLFIVENTAVFDDNWRQRYLSRGVFHAAFDRWSHVWFAVLMSGVHRVTLLAVFVLPLAWVLLYPPYHGERPVTTVQASVGLDIQRANLRIDGDRRGVITEFAHADHQKRLGGDSSCATCHHVSMPGDRSTPCSRCHSDMVFPTTIFDHAFHTGAVAEKEKLGGLYPSNHSCGHCHGEDQPKTADGVKTCFECHREDMWLVGKPDSTMDLMNARSFRDAMHGTCIECHTREKERVAKPHLDECATCHRSLQARLVSAGPGQPEGVEVSMIAPLTTGNREGR